MFYNFFNKFFKGNIDNFFNDLKIDKKIIFGFWIYIMSDCIIFATVFSVYFVMVKNISNGPSGKEFFNLHFVELETFFLLLSSLFFSIAVDFLKKYNINMVCLFLLFVFLLGLSFLLLEGYEFFLLSKKNYYPTCSGFLSVFYTLLFLHGFHVISGLIWIILMIFQIILIGINKTTNTRILCLSIFWHFLDIIWIFVFTFVYLFGVI
ncbi:MAG: cytochrome o ubiquinol oxidase subunit III [Buchnera aphidicola (Periphyllus acericola)]|uniref:cytochrome c oxidase subunit 3 n=1 Tax=Buchnera aphidicola TaxID=9 RepID=UPI0030D2CB2B|nr:cytochrome o ubiquinol oxidase subunit III [Buchnera aphidicola (Periphyllus acericola)]